MIEDIQEMCNKYFYCSKIGGVGVQVFAPTFVHGCGGNFNSQVEGNCFGEPCNCEHGLWTT
jgi:hypothetical protein